MEDFRFSQ